MRITNLKAMILALLCTGVMKCAFSQKREHYIDLCNCLNTTYNSLYAWKEIYDTSTFKKPFANVVHLGIKRKNDEREHYATASFIGKSCVITALHFVKDSANIEYIDVRIPSVTVDRWIRFYKGSFLVHYYTEDSFSNESDIVIVQFLNIPKIQQVYKSNFRIADFNIKDHDSLTINITGFPCLRFCYNGKGMDTLVNRFAGVYEVEVNAAGTCLRIPRSTCPGDSGSPVWCKLGDEYYIIGTVRGGPIDNSGLKNLPDNTYVILINENKRKWINTVLQNETLTKK